MCIRDRSSTLADKTNYLLQPILKVYPNPSTGDRILLEYQHFTSDKLQLEIWSMNGSLVYKAILNNTPKVLNKTTISAGNLQLTPGMYAVRLYDKSNHRALKLIIK